MLKKIQDVFLCLYVFSVGFEYWDPFGLSGIISISKIISIVYLATLMPHITEYIIPKFRRGITYSIICYLILYYVISIIYSGSIYFNSLLLSSTFALNVLMFFMISNHIIINGRPTLIKVLITITTIPILQVILISNKIGYTMSDDNRLLLFGDNPNNVGAIAAVTLLTSIILVLDNSLRLSKKRFFLVVSVLTSVSVILATASRGAIISVGLAMIAFLILRKMTIGRKIAFMLLISGMIYLFYTTVESSEWVALRMQQLFEEGDQSRISIYQDISHFAFDSPIFGLGETGYYNKMVQYRGSFKASHNGFLDVYLYTGIVGCICFLTFLSYLIQFCWRLHKRQNISIATTLFIIIIFNFAKSGSGWNTKIMWVVFSIIVGMYYIYNTKRKNMVKKPLNIKQ